MRCRPGDLAVVVRGEASGLFVTVLRREHVLAYPNDIIWWCRIATATRIDKVDLDTGRYMGKTMAYAGEEVLLNDAALQPIRPPPTPATLPPVTHHENA